MEQHEYMPAPHHLSPGTVLNGKYEIGAVLGEGGFGITYIGQDINLDMKIAVKEYFPSGIVNRNSAVSAEVTVNVGDAQADFKKGKENFLKEARTLAKFANNPSIVSVRDFFAENNTAYIVMEYLCGIDLKEYLEQNGVMSFGKAFEMLSPIMSALSKIHEQGLIHRDISPSNIMVLSDGVVKLLDFGAARDVGGTDEKSLSIMLKPGYAPEEQYRTKGRQGPWTDVYALAATMYKLITGVTPDDAMNRIFKDELTAPSSINPDISKEQDNIVLKGMAIQKENRFQSIEDLQKACLAGKADNTEPTEFEAGEVTVSGDMYFNNNPDINKAEKPVTEVKQPKTPVRDTKKTALEKHETLIQPQKSGLVISTITGLISLIMLSLILFAIQEEAFTGVTLSICFMILAIFVGATFFAGRKYYPYINNKERKPNRVCFAVSVVMIAIVVLIVLGMVITGTSEYSNMFMVFILNILAIAVFMGYFYYPRLERKKILRRLKIWGGVIAALFVMVIISVVFTGFNTITIGDKHIMKNADSVTISYDIINDNDIAKLKELKNLEKLIIKNCFMDDNDVKVIGELTKLKELSLEGNTDITDVSPLNNLTNLNTLNLNKTKTKDISCLNNLTGLHFLYINETNVSDISIIGTYQNLIILHMDSVSGLNTQTITIPESVTNLSCMDDGIDDISFLSGVTGLETFHAGQNKISDISILAGCPLGDVRLNKNNISNISALADKTRLSNLDLSDNDISDITPLTSCTAIFIKLNNNNISDISPLVSNTRLCNLELVGNPVSDFSGISFHPEESNYETGTLNISYNEMIDWQVLRLGNVRVNVYGVNEQQVETLRGMGFNAYTFDAPIAYDSDETEENNG